MHAAIGSTLGNGTGAKFATRECKIDSLDVGIGASIDDKPIVPVFALLRSAEVDKVPSAASPLSWRISLAMVIRHDALRAFGNGRRQARLAAIV